MGNGVPERTRTSDLQVRNLMLYPLSYGHTSRSLADGWRRGRDSNPRKRFTPFNGLANRRTRPLCDLSVIAADDSMGPRPGRTRRPRLKIPSSPRSEEHTSELQ